MLLLIIATHSEFLLYALYFLHFSHSVDYGSAATEVKADPAKPFIKTPANQYPPASSFGMYAPFQWQQNGFEFFPANPVSNGFSK